MENIVDPRLEHTDPTPDIYKLMQKFSSRFFWNKLGMVELGWSGHMTSASGVCSFQPRSGFCSIRLSSKLLSLRMRKDLVETLLHEMIHAYLFVTGNSEAGHGPKFREHMNRINREAGTNINVTHSFIAEVSHLQKHKWRCNGPCQNIAPMYGVISSGKSKPPGPHDLWWNQHKAVCSGVFTKITQEHRKRQSQKVPKKGSSSSSQNHVLPPTRVSNIHTFADIQNLPEKMLQNSGSGFARKGIPKSSTQTTNFLQEPTSSNAQISSNVNMHVRKIWSEKFYKSSDSSPLKRKSDTLSDTSSKMIAYQCKTCQKMIDLKDKNSHAQKCNFKKFFSPVCNPKNEGAMVKRSVGVGSNSKPKSNGCDDVREVECIDEKVKCPICGVLYAEIIINRHIDECLNLKAINAGAVDT